MGEDRGRWLEIEKCPTLMTSDFYMTLEVRMLLRAECVIACAFIDSVFQAL